MKKYLFFMAIICFVGCSKQEDVKPEKQEGVKLEKQEGKIVSTLNLLENPDLFKDDRPKQRRLKEQPCTCTFRVTDVSESLNSLPGSAYWLAGLYYTDYMGMSWGPYPIGVSLFPSEFEFYPMTPSSFTVEGAYAGGPTYPGGSFSVEVRCVGANSGDQFTRTFDIAEGLPIYQEFVNSRITSRCQSLPVFDE